MRADDARHGTRRGYYAHRRDNEDACADCKRGASTAQARYEMNQARGISRRVDPTGTRRRLQALCALGWTFRTLDNELGHQNLCVKWVHEERQYIYASTAAKIAALYDRLSMSFPAERTREERINATRARNLARRYGWPPPLAWDRIDDPDEKPRGWEYSGVDRQSRRDILLDLDEQHAGITAACRALRIKREAIEKWAERYGERPLYERLVARETRRYWVNQYAEGGVA